MKRKKPDTQRGLFDQPAWEQEAQTRAAPTVEVADCVVVVSGARGWVECRAAVLVKMRGMSASDARRHAGKDYLDTLD